MRLDRGGQRGAMSGVGDVAGEGGQRAAGQLPLQGGEVGGGPGVDDDAPAEAAQRGGRGAAEAAGCAGDDGDRHGLSSWSVVEPMLEVKANLMSRSRHCRVLAQATPGWCSAAMLARSSRARTSDSR